MAVAFYELNKLLSAKKWCALYSVELINPLGWTDTFEDYDVVDIDFPISNQEFFIRLDRSEWRSISTFN